MSENLNQNQNRTMALVYDLPSENLRNISEEAKRTIRRVRVRSVQLLHALGVQCTESVILIPIENRDQITTTIDRVNSMYRELIQNLEQLGIYGFRTPIIRTLNLTQEQKTTLLPIAKRRLLEELDRTIESVNEIIDSLNEIVEESRRRRIRNNLSRIRRNWNRIFNIAQQLGIDITRDYEFLVEMLEEAYRRV